MVRSLTVKVMKPLSVLLTSLVTVAAALGGYRFLPNQTESLSSRGMLREIIASCDYCVSPDAIVSRARKDLIDLPGTKLGTIEWYRSPLREAKVEAWPKPVTDPTFAGWRVVVQSTVPALWAQAIRLGARVGVRIRSKDGTVTVIPIQGDNLFQKTIGGEVVSLLDVRILQLVREADEPVTVHLLTRKTVDAKTGPAICRAYLSDLGTLQKRIECTVGTDDLRPTDGRYLINNPFHKIVRLPSVPEELGTSITCHGPGFKTCF